MSDGFLKFKKRFTAIALIKSAVFGLSLGILTSSLMILLQKVRLNAVAPLIPILSGVGAMLVGFIALFLILMPRDRRLAKRLDRELGLGERVETMLEYKDDGRDMPAIQREEANERLLALPKNALKEKRILLHVIAPLLAIAMLLPAILVPLQAVTPPPTEEPEPDYNATMWQKTALSELIAYVEASELEAEPKESVLLSLNDLLLTLDTPMPESLLKAEVIEVLLSVNSAIDGVNTFNEISLSMLESENEHIKGLASAIGSLYSNTVKQDLDLIKAKLTRENLAAFEAELSLRLSAVVPVDGDTLLPALLALCEEYKSIHTVMDSYSDQWLESSISSAHNKAFEIISPELFIQNGNDQVRRHVILRLIEIFGLTDEELPDEIKTSVGESGDDNKYDDDDNKDEGLNSGGYGDANQQFGSNDTIYDPQTNTHVPYGEVLNAYYAKVKEQLIAGGTSESLAEFIDAYFSSLYDGSKKNETNQD